jgi:hypothetical protein
VIRARDWLLWNKRRLFTVALSVVTVLVLVRKL